MTDSLNPKLFDGLSVYQDVVLAGCTVQKGVRDCHQRWQVIDPHLPASGAFLDIGSNFGWFGLKICETRPQAVVASVEADSRSALIQRKVLASHEHHRIALLTARANRRLVDRFAAAGQQFQAALCLSILHWIPDHRAFLTQLAQISEQLIIEYPELDEPDAGSAKIRAEIGDLGEYLRRLFPDRHVERIGDCASHLSSEHRRPIWLVGGTNQSQVVQAGIDLEALLRCDLSWPPRSWWLESLSGGNCETAIEPAFAPEGLRGDQVSWQQLESRLKRLPETSLYPRHGCIKRQLRQLVGRVSRRTLQWVR